MGAVIYDIHELLTVSFTKDFFPKFIPEDFRSKKTRRADLVIHECKDIRFDKSCHRRVGSFYGGNGKLFFESSKLGIKQKMSIENLFEKTVFSFTRSLRLFRMEDFVELVRLLLEIKLLQRGCTLVHGAGVSRKSKGYLISARGGIGKTSAMMALSKEGFSLLGDEIVILSENGDLYSFPLPITIHPSTAKVLKLPIGKRIEGKIRPFILKVSPRAPISTGVGVKLSQIGRVEKTSKLEQVFFLEKSSLFKCEKIPKFTAVKKIVNMNKAEFFRREFQRKVFSAYCFLNGLDPKFMETQMEKIFERSFQKCYLVKACKKQHYKLIMRKIT